MEFTCALSFTAAEAGLYSLTHMAHVFTGSVNLHGLTAWCRAAAACLVHGDTSTAVVGRAACRRRLCGMPSMRVRAMQHLDAGAWVSCVSVISAFTWYLAVALRYTSTASHPIGKCRLFVCQQQRHASPHPAAVASIRKNLGIPFLPPLKRVATV